MPLTDRQAEVLSFIRVSIATMGMPPTRHEIAAHFGMRSANGAEQHLRALIKRGLVRVLPGVSRGIRLSGDAANAGAAPPLEGDLAAMRARVIVTALSALDANCMHCEYDEAEGGLLRHCDRCCRRIVAELGKVLRVNQRQISTGVAAKRPMKKRGYHHNVRGGVCG